MGEVIKAEAFGEDGKNSPPNQNEIPADKAKQMAEAAKGTIGRGTASSEKGQPTGERPSWLPEKFKTVEDFTKSYAELEKKLGGKQVVEAGKAPAPEAGKPAEEPAKAPAAADQKSAEEALSKAGLKMEEFSAEFSQKGELSADSYKKLETAGIPKPMVDAYIAGQKALGEKLTSDLHSVAGGKDQFERMHAWSAENLPDSKKQAVNDALATNDPEKIKMAFQSVHADWVKAAQDEPTGQIRGGKSAADAGDVYKYRSEITADMRKKEYQTSEAFRAKVHEKIKRSGI